MKTMMITVTGLLLGTVVHGQSYYERFKQLLTDKDSAGQRNLLEEWETKSSNDPEFYTCCFNYYVQRSMSEVIRIDKNPGKRESLQLMDSTNQVAGYIHGETSYEPEYLSRAFGVIDKGILMFPNRLDMRFGKIHMLGQVNNYDAFTDEIIKSIARSARNKNAWQWTMNEPVKDPKDFLLGNIQTYVNNLYDMGEGQAVNIRRIAETTLKHYPDHVVSLSNLAISYILENRYSQAVDPLLAAEKKAPEDPVILGNLAYVYLQLKDNPKARAYYHKLIRYGNDDAKQFAEEQLKKIRE